jgi:hypothetical protein
MNIPNPGPALPILGVPDPRQIKLQRTRDKLAGNSEKEAQIQKRREEAGRQMAWSRAWRLLAMAAIIALTWAAFTLRDEWTFSAPEKRLPVLSAPVAQMGTDQELLYWTYALYDVKKLRSEFGLPRKTLIDADRAKSRIRELLPKAGGKAAFIARMYQTNRGRIR